MTWIVCIFCLFFYFVFGFLVFMSLLRVPTVKSSRLAEIYFYLSKKSPQIKLEQLSIPNLDLSGEKKKETEKQLSSKTNFIYFLPISCPNFRLKLCLRPKNYQNRSCLNGWAWGQFRRNILFPETVMDKMRTVPLRNTAKIFIQQNQN